MNNQGNNTPIECIINPDGTVNINTVDGTGIKNSKIVSLNSFSSIMRSSEESIELPLMPNGIRKFKQVGDYVIVAIEHPACITQMNCYDEMITVPTPHGIWLHLLAVNNSRADSYRIIKSHIFALTMPLMSEDQEIYQWPYPNFSTDYSPGICWGNDRGYERMKDNVSIRNLSSLFSMYFSASANNDLGWRFNVPEGVNSDWNGKRNFLDNNPMFENSWLQRDHGSSSRKFSEAMEFLLRGYTGTNNRTRNRARDDF